MKKLRVFESATSDVYHDSLSEAIDAIRAKAESKGFKVVDDEVFTQLGTGGISYGTTKKGQLALTKDGLETKKKIAYAIYRMDSGRYELTSYFS